HFRNIRAVFNDALDDEVISCYPFRKFKLRYDETPKRALPIERVRDIFNLRVEEWEQRYIDCFKLIFLLCGINIVDLYGLADIVEDRVEYHMAKTHRFYSIKVEPEAMELIERWRGDKNLLCYSDTTRNYRIFYNRLAHALKGRGLSTYMARHSWATIARKIGVSRDDIKLALGHGAKTVTDIYIDEDREKVDEANRRVIDFVLYGKK
ncbi:MAG: recombinase, partial [Muribaculaceae bacterium]|nr:recombinase [Muribaculaceae bacterium]